jgi:hypothetical protein
MVALCDGEDRQRRSDGAGVISRTLPILTTDNQLIENPFELVWGLMHYPEDLTAACHFHEATVEIVRRSNDETAKEYPRTFGLYAQDMERRRGRAKVAGSVLVDFCAMAELGQKASLRRAVALNAEIGQRQPVGKIKRANYPSDERAVRAAEKEFRNVSHLWAAFMATGSDFGLLATDDLKLAHMLAVALQIGRVRYKNAPTNPWHPWMPPESGMTFPEVKVVFHHDDEAESFLLEYRPLEFRDPVGE